MTLVPNLQNDSLARHQPEKIVLNFTITGAKTAVIQTISFPFQATWGFDTPAGVTSPLGQTTINNLLGSTNEIVAATAFGSTAMGTDAFGFVLKCDGQVRVVRTMSVTTNLGSGGATITAWAAGTATALPDTLPALARVYYSSLGNIAGQFVLAGLDAATTGLIQVEILFESN